VCTASTPPDEHLVIRQTRALFFCICVLLLMRASASLSRARASPLSSGANCVSVRASSLFLSGISGEDLTFFGPRSWGPSSSSLSPSLSLSLSVFLSLKLHPRRRERKPSPWPAFLCLFPGDRRRGGWTNEALFVPTLPLPRERESVLAPPHYVARFCSSSCTRPASAFAPDCRQQVYLVVLLVAAMTMRGRRASSLATLT